MYEDEEGCTVDEWEGGTRVTNRQREKNKKKNAKKGYDTCGCIMTVRRCVENFPWRPTTIVRRTSILIDIFFFYIVLYNKPRK